MFNVITDKNKKFWNQLPVFMAGAKTVRAEIKDSSADMVEDDGPYGSALPWREAPIEEANLITSIVDDFFGNNHRPVLDIDFEAELVPSSTPGHYHLYMDTYVGHDAYMNFLKAAAEAGIIQHGYYEGALKRGGTSARLPWIKKGDKKANALDPDKEARETKERIIALEKELENLRAKLAVDELDIASAW